MAYQCPSPKSGTERREVGLRWGEARAGEASGVGGRSPRPRVRGHLSSSGRVTSVDPPQSCVSPSIKESGSPRPPPVTGTQGGLCEPLTEDWPTAIPSDSRRQNCSCASSWDLSSATPPAATRVPTVSRADLPFGMRPGQRLPSPQCEFDGSVLSSGPQSPHLSSGDRGVPLLGIAEVCESLIARCLAHDRYLRVGVTVALWNR